MDTDHIQIPRIVKNERKVTCQQMFLLNFQKVFFNALGLGVHLLSNVRSVFLVLSNRSRLEPWHVVIKFLIFFFLI